jgi:hypothetical protein
MESQDWQRRVAYRRIDAHHGLPAGVQEAFHFEPRSGRLVHGEHGPSREGPASEGALWSTPL